MTEATFNTDPNSAGGDQATGTSQNSFTPPEGTGSAGATPEEIAALQKRDQHAQLHIQTLEREAAQRKAELEQLRAEQERLAQELKQRASLEELLSKQQPQGDDYSATPELDLNQVVDAVRTSLTADQQKAAATANVEKAVGLAKQVYGEDFAKEVGAIASGLGMTLADVDTLAARSPDAFERLFIKKGSGGVPASGDTVNASGVAGQARDEARQASAKRDPFGKDAFEAIKAKTAN